MASTKAVAPYAIFGAVSGSMREKLGTLGAVRVLSDADLASASSGALSNLEALIIGEGVDIRVLTTWLPSLRTANPTMAVLGLTDGGDPKVLGNWVDEIFASDEAAAEYLERNVRRSPHAEMWWAAAGAGRRVGTQGAAILVLLLVWWAAVAVFNPPPFLLPSPSRVLDAFAQQWDRFTMHLVVTANEAILGFVIGNTLGISLAVLLHKYFRLQKLTMPVLISFQAIPIVAFAPLLGVWLGTGLTSKVAMAAIICFFPMVVNALQAFSAVEREYLELFNLYRATYRNTLTRLLLPASASAIIAALKISAGLAVVGAIVAEMTGADRGLGYLILNGAYRLETDIMFVAMLLSGLLGVTFFHMPDIIRTLLPPAWVRGLGA